MAASVLPSVLLIVPAIYLYLILAERKLRHIPTVGGPSLPILSFLGFVRYLVRGHDLIQEGYVRYKGGVFKYKATRGWTVIVTSTPLIEELRRAADDELSFAESTNEVLQIPYTLGANIHHNPYHIPIVRSQLTRNLSTLFPDLRDEIAAAFNDEIPLKGDDWVKIRARDAITQIVCRTSNRVFVGLPLCRDPDYCELNKRFTIDVVTKAYALSLLPDVLKPIVGKLLKTVERSVDRGVEHVEPLITKRLNKMNELGDEWADKPTDMLQWLIEDAQGEERTVRALVLRILTVNFAAIHTSSMGFINVLHYLAAHPQYVQPMREEVDAVLEQEGWSKTALGKMRRVDSFIREVQRLTGLGATSMQRLALKDFTFSDGTFIPAGTFVAVPVRAIHYDEEIYPHATLFDPWRFSSMRDEDGEGTKHSAVSTSTEYILFGHGRHACPGRFFAVNELKAMLAHILLTYDVRLEGKEGVLPPARFVGGSLVPDMEAQVLFRRRQA
ncbi:uncharacterized protein FIBRA_02859 [Fibroporia radiculosa]|uniref:Cytochrome P450 n=1 Tax=Fibroporia radiculosa TaxID=599839 RepID=J4HVL9_9APHY|nr:uncharacterized protein FIBRA_02859 [Fibroporia radiculosa]CCM00817.1 predicted protein [Fibroporia radiculosa]